MKTISSIYSSIEAMYLHYSKGERPPTTEGKACVHLKKVVDPETVTLALQELRNTPPRPTDEKNRKHFFPGNRIWQEIQFNEQHEPVGFTFFSENISKVTNQSLKRFGTELKLQGLQSIAVSYIHYQIPQEGLNAYGWHTDNSTSWTMITLLTNPDDPQKGWTGGDLSRSTFYFDNRRGHVGFYQPSPSVQTFSYQQHDAILFHNYSTFHQVEAMYPRGQSGDRIILQIALEGNNGMFHDNANYIDKGDQQEMNVKRINNDDIRA